MPKFHGQFARFRGYVFLDATDASLLPWNTTKTGVDIDTDVWRNTYLSMRLAMRPVIDFLNKVADEQERSEADQFLTKAMSQAPMQTVKSIIRVGGFASPQPPKGPKPPPKTYVQFSRLKAEVEELREFYSAQSNSELGGMLFDESYEQNCGN